MNWEDFTKLSYEEANLAEMERYDTLASNWKTCIVGQIFPDQVKTMNPTNRELVSIGCLFAGAVRQMRWAVKSRSKKQFEEYRKIVKNNIKKTKALKTNV